MRYLEAIYRLKSYTKAAEELFISQPSLSNAIHSLEKELGVSLIDRSRQPLRFTFEGERFMWHVYSVCLKRATRTKFTETGCYAASSNSIN